MELASEALKKEVAKATTKTYTIDGVDVIVLNKDEALVMFDDITYGAVDNNIAFNESHILKACKEHDEDLMNAFRGVEGVRHMCTNMHSHANRKLAKHCYALAKRDRDYEAAEMRARNERANLLIKDNEKKRKKALKEEEAEEAFKKTLSDSGYELFKAGILQKGQSKFGAKALIELALNSIVDNDAIIIKSAINNVKVIVPKDVKSILKILECSDIHFSKK